MLESTGEALVRRHDVLMLDLDGVVYIGEEGVPGAAEHLAGARDLGARLAFVTNNASRPPAAVVDHLVSVGIPATPDDVVTSAQAAAHLVIERWGPQARVVPLGGAGVAAAVAEAGARLVGVDDPADVVVTGYGPEVVWRDIMTIAVRVRGGLAWIAANSDLTIPTPQGPAPGHGLLVGMLTGFTGVVPAVAGKPEPPLLETTMARTGAASALMVGDRLDTDIAGGSAVGVPSLLVMTGVTGIADLVACAAGERPTYISADLAGLLESHPEVRAVDGEVCLRGWRARVRDGELALVGSGSTSDWWRAAAVAAWHHLDTEGMPVGVAGLHPQGVGRRDAVAGDGR